MRGVLAGIGLRAGQVVRLSQGDYDRQTTYGDAPAETARAFADAGATWVHVVDLDGARAGAPANRESVRAIRRAVSVRIELGGGLRDTDAVRAALDAGADRAVVGSAAVKDWTWFESLLSDASIPNERLALGLDARSGRLAAEGWTEQLEVTAEDLARRVAGSGLGAIVHTDIARDGMLSGVNAEATRRVIAATDVPVIASGGVRGLDDIRTCRRIACAGVIIGRAYYEGRLSIEDAIAASKEGQTDSPNSRLN